MYCLKCATSHSDDTVKCENCNFIIEGEAANGKIYGPHYMQLHRASNEMLNNEISIELYQTVIENFQAVLEELQDDLGDESEIDEIETIDEVKGILEEPAKFVREGLNCYWNAVEILETYFETLDPEIIIQGLEFAEKGNDYLKLAEELARYVASEFDEIEKESEANLS
jgi:hypothetical protein